MPHISYVDASRTWSRSYVGRDYESYLRVGNEEISLGCQLRIADALERIADLLDPEIRKRKQLEEIQSEDNPRSWRHWYNKEITITDQFIYDRTARERALRGGAKCQYLREVLNWKIYGVHVPDDLGYKIDKNGEYSVPWSDEVADKMREILKQRDLLPLPTVIAREGSKKQQRWSEWLALEETVTPSSPEL